MGQQTEFPCPEMWSFYPWIPAHFHTWKLHPLAHIPPGRGTGVFIHGQWMEFPCPEMCRDLWIKTLEPLPGGIQVNGQSFHVQKCAGVQSPFLKGYRPMD